MKFDFDKIYNRLNTNCEKWDEPRDTKSSIYTKAEKIIPMWVADMDFAMPDCVLNAIKERCDHPIFGYFIIPEKYYEAINEWHKNHYDINYNIENSDIMYQNSVLGGVSSFITAYSLSGDNILMNSPTYTGFIGTVKNLGRNVCTSKLKLDDNNIYRIDFNDMEQTIIKKNISIFIFCSPHNPTGRVWEKWEIEKVIELCDKYDVKIVSDEIWSDFIMDKTLKHIPTQSVNETARNITMSIYAPSKTFNIAGLVGGYSIIFNKNMKSKISKIGIATHYNEPNILSCSALIGGYENGADWVDEMTSYIRNNQKYVVNYINKHFEDIIVYLPQATYLLWIDFSEYITTNEEFENIYSKMLELGVLPSNGKFFLGEKFIRLNVACPHSLCVEAMEILYKVLKK